MIFIYHSSGGAIFWFSTKPTYISTGQYYFTLETMFDLYKKRLTYNHTSSARQFYSVVLMKKTVDIMDNLLVLYYYYYYYCKVNINY